MKDFYDLWVLASSFPFDGRKLAAAIGATFERRATPLPEAVPVGLSDEFASDRGKQQQWKAFQHRARPALPPPALADVTSLISRFLLPPTNAVRLGRPWTQQWPEGGPWRS